MTIGEFLRDSSMVFFCAPGGSHSWCRHSAWEPVWNPD